MKTAKAIAEEVKAREELIKRGWTQPPCSSCKGVGYYMVGDSMRECSCCRGKGYLWRGPMH